MGAGALGDVGYQGGRNYSVNVPLQEGMDDESYKFVFEPIMQKVRSWSSGVFPEGSCVSLQLMWPEGVRGWVVGRLLLQACFL